MGLLSFLSGNSKSVEKIVDAGVNGVDALFYTEEEKAQHRQEMQKLYHKYVEIAASESTTQSISRRMICLPVVYVWLFLILLDVGTQMMGYMFPAIGNAIIQMNNPALAAIGFYVGRHIMTNK